MKKVFLVVSLFAALLSLNGCKNIIGLGSEIDLEGPVVKVESPASLSKVHLKFTLSGTCTDNQKVESVTISNFTSGKEYGKATISGNSWTFPIELDSSEQGELTIQVSALDELGNQSAKSKKVITYLVDDTAPTSEDWYIERNQGITISLYSDTHLATIDTSVSINKDIPQNQSFKIHGKVTDSMSVNSVTVSLLDGTALVASKTVTGSYTPEVTFTHQDMVAANSKYATGKHYFQIKYTAQDDHENSYSDTPGYLLWYPESDNPGIVQNGANTQGKISMDIKNSIPIEIFDDDEVAEYHIAIKNEDSPQLQNVTAAQLVTDEAKRNAVFDQNNVSTTKAEFVYSQTNVESGTREVSYITDTSIDAVQLACAKKLVICVKDAGGKWSAKIYTVLLTDGDIPVLYIESPENGAVPSINANTTSTFTIKGYAMDKRDSSKEGVVKIAYIPEAIGDSTAKEARAREVFKDAAVTGDSGSKTDFSDGVKVYWHKTTWDSTTSGWQKRNYSFDFDLLTAFGTNGGTIDKYFGIMYTDNSGNDNYKSLNVAGDKIKPTITISPIIKTDSTGSTVTKNSSDNMFVVNHTTESLILSFKGSKTNGLPMDSSSYKLYREGDASKLYTLEQDQNSGGYKTTISSSDLQALVAANLSQPTFVFEVKDIFGNVNVERRTVVLSDLPYVTAIKTDKNPGTYKIGDVLTFQVEFSKEVKVTGTPQLVLHYVTGDTAKYADYASGSGSKTLTFSFTVPQGAVSDAIVVDSDTYINLNGGKIETASLGTGDAKTSHIAYPLEQKTLKIDGVKPYFEKIKYTTTVSAQADGKKYVKADDTITAVLTANEDVLVSGTPQIFLNVGTNTFGFNFQGINGKEVTFVHKVTNRSYDSDGKTIINYGTYNGTVGLNGNSYISGNYAKTIADAAGNTLEIKSLTADSCDTIVIDTEAPDAPTVNITDNKLTVSDTETGASIYYSLNGGLSWQQYTGAVALTSGTYQITAKQKDFAGNESDASDAIVKTISAFPNFASLIVSNKDGYYKTGNKITFILSFDDNVYYKSGNLPKLTFPSDGSHSVTFDSWTGGTKTITATYTVKDTDSINGLTFKSLDLGGIKDANDNAPSTMANYLTATSTLLQNSERSGIIIDSVVPALAETGGQTPANGGVLTMASENGGLTVVLKFTEPVYVEKGYITLQRIGADNTTNADNWAIPAVLSNTEFMNIYNQLGTTDREILMVTDAGNGSGSEKLQDETARPVGPYMKYTHGINADGSPDQTTKFVLAPEYDIFGTTETVASIRTVLKKTGYHQHKVDINSSQVTGNGTDTITIKFNDSIDEGQHWALLMDSTCLRDQAGNYFAGFADVTKYNFWSKQVAQPVVRVFRYSHNVGASEPTDGSTSGTVVAAASVSTQNITQWTANGTYYNNANAASATKMAPTGYAQVRIDCETPGAVIKFAVTNAGTIDADSATNNPPGFDGGEKTYNYYNADKDSDAKYGKVEDKATTSFTAPDTSYSQGQRIIIGDGLYKTASIDYVSAQATAPSSASTMTASDRGYEGVFKTVVNYVSGANGDTHQSQIQIQGGTFNGGMPSIPGFPLRDALTGEPHRYNQNSYYDSTDKYHYWVTYDIISEFSILSVYSTSSWSRSYSYGIYGGFSKLVNVGNY